MTKPLTPDQVPVLNTHPNQQRVDHAIQIINDYMASKPVKVRYYQVLVHPSVITDNDVPGVIQAYSEAGWDIRCTIYIDPVYGKTTFKDQIDYHQFILKPKEPTK